MGAAPVACRSALEAVCLVVLSALAACGDGSDQAGGSPPAPEVVVETVEARSVPLILEYPGRVAGFREVKIRARVEGILLSREYEEGAIVQQGDVLFRIDPSEYAATAQSANARLAEAEANLRNARQRWERIKALFDRGTASAATRDDARSSYDQARAALEQAKAGAKAAGLSLDYTTVVAPITGATSMETRSEGSLVGTAADQAPLTTITQLDPVYVNFSPAETEISRLREGQATGRLSTPEDGKLSASLTLGDGSRYKYDGIVDFTDNTVDLETGTIRMRAIFDNPEQRLIPGQFVRVEVQGFRVENAITVPKRALAQAPEGAYVYTVTEDGSVSRRAVELGEALPDRWVILSGLEAGEQVIVEGTVKAQNGGKVTPVERGEEGVQEQSAAASTLEEAKADAPVETPQAREAESTTQ